MSIEKEDFRKELVSKLVDSLGGFLNFKGRMKPNEFISDEECIELLSREAEKVFTFENMLSMFAAKSKSEFLQLRFEDSEVDSKEELISLTEEVKRIFGDKYHPYQDNPRQRGFNRVDFDNFEIIPRSKTAEFLQSVTDDEYEDLPEEEKQEFWKKTSNKITFINSEMGFVGLSDFSKYKATMFSEPIGERLICFIELFQNSYLSNATPLTGKEVVHYCYVGAMEILVHKRYNILERMAQLMYNRGAKEKMKDGKKYVIAMSIEEVDDDFGYEVFRK